MTRSLASVTAGLLPVLLLAAGCENDPASPSNALPDVRVFAGGLHTCALTADGALYCWGANSLGQLGDGSRTDRASPVPVVGGRTYSDAVAGDGHTCAIATDGTAYCWGWANFGIVGDSVRRDDQRDAPQPEPVRVAGGHTFRVLGAGSTHTCGIDPGGAGYCWGFGGGDGRLGNDGFIAYAPTPIEGGLDLAAVDGGEQHSCGLTAAGRAYCWGDNRAQQLGARLLSPNRDVPVAVAGGLSFRRIAAGAFHTCALDRSGRAYCWGYGMEGQLGRGIADNADAPVRVDGGLTFRAVAAGRAHTCALTSAGRAYCWGDNEAGQLGDGTLEPRPTPVAVATETTFAWISAGGRHTCASTDDGAIYCWGDGSNGQLGQGSTASSSFPVRVGAPF